MLVDKSLDMQPNSYFHAAYPAGSEDDYSLLMRVKRLLPNDSYLLLSVKATCWLMSLATSMLHILLEVHQAAQLS